jgi:hypothetical protein
VGFLWFGAVYLLTGLAGGVITAGGSAAPLGPPVTGVPWVVIGSIGLAAMAGSRSRYAIKVGAAVAVAGILGTLAVLGMTHT